MADTLRFDKASPEMQNYIQAAAAAYGLPVDVLATVMQNENGAFSLHPPDGSKHEIGPMQLLPETRQILRKTFPLSDDQMRDPKTNTLLGAYWLRQKINANQGRIDRGIVAYNGAGPEAEAYGRRAMNRLKPSAGTPLTGGQTMPQQSTQSGGGTVFDDPTLSQQPGSQAQPGGGDTVFDDPSLLQESNQQRDLAKQTSANLEQQGGTPTDASLSGYLSRLGPTLGRGAGNTLSGLQQKYLPAPGTKEWKALPKPIQAFETGPAQFAAMLKEPFSLNPVNIAYQYYQHAMGRPSTLGQMPRRAIETLAPFLIGAPMAPEAEEAAQTARYGTMEERQAAASARATRQAVTAAQPPGAVSRVARAVARHTPVVGKFVRGYETLQDLIGQQAEETATRTRAPRTPTLPRIKQKPSDVPLTIRQAAEGLGKGPVQTIEDMAAVLQGRPVPPPPSPGPPRVPPFWQTGQPTESPVRPAYGGQAASQAYAEQRAAERAARAAGKVPPPARPPRTPPAWQTAVPPEPIPRQASPTATESQAYVQQRAAERAARQMTPEARATRARAALDELAQQAKREPKSYPKMTGRGLKPGEKMELITRIRYRKPGKKLFDPEELLNLGEFRRGGTIPTLPFFGGYYGK